MADVLQCKNLSGEKHDLCVEIFAYDEAPDEKAMWECVEDTFVKGGGSPEELQKDANQGFWANPFEYRRFVNNPHELEIQEKIEYAYSDPKYYECLHKTGYPVSFAMNNFIEKKLFDDQMQYEIGKAIKKIITELAGKADKYPADTDEYRAELGKRLFDWAQASLKFNADCKIEGYDYEAVENNCGLCSESSAAMYYIYRAAGLKPAFFRLRDWKPSLEWIAILEKLENIQEHVFIGIPMETRDPIHVDLINKKFDARYTFATEISPRQFTIGWLSNKRIDLDNLRKYDKSAIIDKMITDLAPEEFEPYESLFLTFNATDKGEKADIVFEAAKGNFTDNQFAMAILDIMGAEALEKTASDSGLEQAEIESRLKSMVENFDQRLKELIATDPQAASMLLLNTGRNQISNVLPKYLARKEEEKKGAKLNQDEMNFYRKVIRRAIGNIGKSLSLDPNSIFAYRDLEKLFMETGWLDDAINFYEDALKSNPEHALFLFSHVKYLLALSSATSNTDEVRSKALLAKAFGSATKLMRLEPEHPIPYKLLSMCYAARKDLKLAAQCVESANKMKRAKSEKPSLEDYNELLSCYVFLADENGMKKTLKSAVADYPDAARTISEYFHENFIWSFNIITANGDDGNIINDETLKIPDNIKETFANLVAILVKLCDMLDKYPSARKGTDAIRAYSLPFVAMFANAGEADEWLDEIADVSSKTNQDGLLKGLNQIKKTFLTTNAKFDYNWYKNIEEFADSIAPHTGDSGRRILFDLKLGIARGYILHRDASAARRLIGEIIKDNIINPVGIPDLVQNLFLKTLTDEAGVRTALVALDLMWEFKESFAPKFGLMLADYYEQMIPYCEKNGLADEALLTKSRAEKLRASD